MENEDLVALTADIASSYVASNQISAGDVSKLVQTIHQALASLGGEPVEVAATYEPAVSVRSSIKPDYLVCLECGAHQKTLKRHLQSAHGLSPDDYRERYGLRSDYPLTAPDYSERRSAMAKALGLGVGGRKPAKRTPKKAASKK
jgi:predicted transcriptional regulator